MSDAVAKCLTFSQTSPGFTFFLYKYFENTVCNGEIARNEQFLLLLSTHLENFPAF